MTLRCTGSKAILHILLSEQKRVHTRTLFLYYNIYNNDNSLICIAPFIQENAAQSTLQLIKIDKMNIKTEIECHNYWKIKHS